MEDAAAIEKWQFDVSELNSKSHSLATRNAHFGVRAAEDVVPAKSHGDAMEYYRQAEEASKPFSFIMTVFDEARR